MKIVVERDALLSALTFIEKHVSAKDTVPILAHAKLEATASTLTITGTNIDRAARTGVLANCGEGGELCLPAAMLAKAVKVSAGAEVSIESEGKRAMVSIGRARFTFEALPSNDFPDMKMLYAEAGTTFSLPAEELLSLEKKVGFCPSDDINRYYLRGTYWHAAGGKMAYCCLDGITMSMLEREALPPGVTEISAIVPQIGLPQWAGDVQVAISPSFIRFASGNDVVASKLIEGNFIDYRRVVASLDNRVSALFDRKEMQDAINRVMVNSDGSAHSVLFSGENGRCIVSTRTAKGDAEDEIAFEGEDFIVAITSRVIRPILASIESEIVEMRYADAATPVLFIPKSEPGRTLFAYPYRDPRITGVRATGDREAA